jgi:hypothetical protein
MSKLNQIRRNPLISCPRRLTGAVLAISLSSCVQSPTINIDPMQTYQTMGYQVSGAWTGSWEATGVLGNDLDPAYSIYANAMMDMAIDEFNINRIRLEIRSSEENVASAWQTWRDSGVTGASPEYCRWRESRYATVDDGGGPHHINWSGFRFNELDHQIEKVIIPYRNRLAQKGIPLFINLNYVSFNGQISNPGGRCPGITPTLDYHHTRDPQEYAEFILAAYLHMQRKYGFVPHSLEVILEPENTSAGYPGNAWPAWDLSFTIAAAEAAADRLAANGFTPRLVLPSATSAATVALWAEPILQHFQSRGKLHYIQEIAYHPYRGRDNVNRSIIASAAAQFRVNTSQLEWFSMTDIGDMHNDLKVGNNSAWQLYTFPYYINVDTSSPGKPVLRYSKIGQLIRQYQKFIQPGAVRVEATTNDPGFDPLAFRNSTGHYVVVVRTQRGGNVSVTGLPAGTYGIQHTTNDRLGADLSDVSLQAGGTLTTSIPATGVITIYWKGKRVFPR